MIFFAKITQISDFFAFPNCRKISKFAASALGGLRPDTLTKGFAPGPRWRLCFQTPVVDSHYPARHGAVPPDVVS